MVNKTRAEENIKITACMYIHVSLFKDMQNS